jgi:hypothetical protein
MGKLWAEGGINYLFHHMGLRASSLVFSRRNRGFVTISLVFYISVLFSKTQLIPHPEEKFY